MIKQTLYAAFVIVAASASSAFADDHVIRPQCWEENKDGQLYRHCEVHRDARAPSSVPAPEPSQQDGRSPTAAAAPPYPPPMRAWPSSQLCAYGPPCPVYYDYRPAPPMPKLYGLPPPFFYFQFGPFGFVVP
jgi:hypothetical protein